MDEDGTMNWFGQPTIDWWGSPTEEFEEEYEEY